MFNVLCLQYNLVCKARLITMIKCPEPCQAVVKRHATHVAGGVASEADRELADELRTLGNAALKAGDHLGAYESYSRGILAVAGSAWEGLVALHNNRSASAMELGWHACARDDACDALAVDAKAVKAWFRLARALVALGDPAAVVVCEHAARLAPQDKAIRELRQRAVNRSASSYKAAAPVAVAVATKAVDREAADSDSDEDFDDVVVAECVKFDVATLTQTTGGTVWDAALLLAHWLAAKLDLRGLRCLEVGAGCGAVGLACAALGARHVGLTDNDGEVVAHLAGNARRNGFEHVVDAYELDFCKPPGEPRADYDVVVGSECVYYDSCGALADFVAAAVPPEARSADRPCAVFCMADSRVGIDAFAATARRAGFAYERVPFPRELRRRARSANPAQLAGVELNTHSVHVLYPAAPRE